MRLLVKFDQFGHNFKLSYQGEETYQTRLGGLCTFILKVLTLIMIVVHTESMIEMDDPKIISYARPLSHQEKLEQKPVNFAEEGFGVGVTTLVNGYPGIIPFKVGQLKAYRIFDEYGYRREEIKLKNIDEFMSDKYSEDMHSGLLWMMKNGYVYGADPAECSVNQFSDATET